MNREQLLEKIKQAIHEVETDADIILYGSQSRKDAVSESDWDFLVLVNRPVDDELTDEIRHRLYEIEWECGEVLCAIVRNRKEWNSALFQATPFHKNIECDGIVL